MADQLKSTLDVAMKKTDDMLGDGKVRLTDAQKEQIAEVRREYEAKVAEKKILLAGSEELTIELQKLTNEKEDKINEIYKQGNQQT